MVRGAPRRHVPHRRCLAGGPRDQAVHLRLRGRGERSYIRAALQGGHVIEPYIGGARDSVIGPVDRLAAGRYMYWFTFAFSCLGVHLHFPALVYICVPLRWCTFALSGLGVHLRFRG